MTMSLLYENRSQQTQYCGVAKTSPGENTPCKIYHKMSFLHPAYTIALPFGSYSSGANNPAHINAKRAAFLFSQRGPG